MRTILFTLLFVLVVVTVAGGAEIGVSVARTVAQNWHLSNMAVAEGVLRVSEVTHTFTLGDQGENCLHIFNMKSGGFVIVAADDRSIPVLGYSPVGSYNPADAPPAFIALMRQFSVQILRCRKESIPHNVDLQRRWDALRLPGPDVDASATIGPTGAVTDVQPLLQTKWNQGWPFNKACPTDASGPGGHVVTGCVATALAQIMAYYRYPHTGFGNYRYYHKRYGFIDANFGATVYRWQEMPTTLDEASPSAQQDAVAQILYHCGVIVEMDYGTDGSGAFLSSVPTSLFQFFDYAIPTLINGTTHPMDTLPQILRDQLNKQQPVYYAAADVGNGARHALVCDGYAAGDFFHFNFGWGGAADGYYYLSSVNPALRFTGDYEAIVDILPGHGMNIRTNTTWSGQRVVQNRIGICGGATLNIEPGSKIDFGRYGGLTVYGAMRAVGTPDQPILFIAADSMVGWNGIEFNRALPILSLDNKDSSKMVHCRITQARPSYLSITSMCGVTYRVTAAIRATDYSELLLDRCTIAHNIGAFRGSAIDIYHSSPRISHCSIIANEGNFGAGVLISGATWAITSPVLEHNLIRENGALIGENGSSGGGIVCETSASPLIINNVIEANRASRGSALFAYYDAYPKIIGNIIADNQRGSALVLDNATAHVVNNTIVGNDGCGIELNGVAMATIRNNILWGQKQLAVAIGQDGVATINNCLIERGRNGVTTSWSNVTFRNNIDANPRFSEATDFSISDSSPAVNAGSPFHEEQYSPNVDLTLHPRVFGGRVDIGACENQHVVAPDEVAFDPDSVVANVNSSDSVLVRVARINGGRVTAIRPLHPPLRLVMNADTSLITIQIAGAPDGQLSDSLVMTSTVGDRCVPLSLMVGQAVSGSVSGVWSSGNIKVKGDITVPPGQTLRILPGTRVEFLGHYKLEVQGRLVARGEDNNRIFFSAATSSVGWKGLRFVSPAAGRDTSWVGYCVLQGGKNRGENLERDGGAICARSFAHLVIDRCLIEGNDADGYAGGGIFLGNCSDITVSNTIIRNNIALDGGALYIVGGADIRIAGNIIYSNTGNDAGGINIASSSPLIAGNLLFSNRGAWGGAFRIWGESDPRVYNNTVVFNSAEDGGGFMVDYYSNPSLVNNIIYGNTAVGRGSQVCLGNYSHPSFYNNDIQFGREGFGVGTDYVPQCTYLDNLDAHPAFQAAGSHAYYLDQQSSCRNSGRLDIGPEDLLSDFDLLGSPRVMEGRIDIGAYEFNPAGITGFNEVSALPTHFELQQNYPNPFNPTTWIRFALPTRSSVQLTIFNALGQRVAVLVSEERAAGYHEVKVDASQLSSGVYFCRLQAGSYVETKKLLLLR